VESPHIFTGSFRANRNGCRVSRGKNGKCSGGGGVRATRRQGKYWGMGTLAACWTLVKPGWLGTASGVWAASMAEVKSEGRDFMSWHASAMMSSMSRWPSVSDHPAMEVAIKMQF
jgi:hypothetical protein